MQCNVSGKVLASRLRRVADVLERFDVLPFPVNGEPLDEEVQPGAALMLMFIRDLFTGSTKEVYTRDEILVFLNLLQNDRELFSLDLVTLMEQED